MIVEHGNLRLILKAGPIGKFQRHVLVIVQNRDVDGRFVFEFELPSTLLYFALCATTSPEVISTGPNSPPDRVSLTQPAATLLDSFSPVFVSKTLTVANSPSPVSMT